MRPRKLASSLLWCAPVLLAAAPASAATLTAAELLEGDLVITEIMKNPNMVADYYGEWFEVYNASGYDVDLKGLYLWDAGTDSYTVASSVVVAAGDYAVFSLSSNSAVNGGIPAVDVKYTSSTYHLDNGADEIWLANDSVFIDVVEYDATSFPNTAGASLSLAADSMDATANDAGDAWCDATSTYGLGDAGTPGSANDDCGAGGLADLPVGALVVTEIMKDPTKVSDYYGEYFEIYNASGVAVDLNGLVVSDLGTDSFTVTSSVPLAAGETALFAVGASGTNGGIPSLDYDYPSASFRLDNSADEIVLSYGAIVFDTVAYTTSFPNTPGSALSLDPTLWDADSNDAAASWCAATSTYGSGDYGTPDGANDVCSADGDGDGYSESAGDCDDTDPTAYPGATETYDLVDDDCDGLVDETLVMTDDLVITEIQYNPNKVLDAYGEYFEVYNASGRDLDLIGWVFKGSDGDTLTVGSSLVVPAGEIAVLGSRSDTSINGGVTVDYAYSRATFKLNNDVDDIIATVGGAEVTRAGWDTSWPLFAGKALEIDADYYGGGYGEALDAWCVSATTYGLGDYGSPGSLNGECDIIDSGLFINGDIVITEIMKDPAMVPDYYGEYFEVYNRSGYPVDLAGLVVKDSGTDTFTVSEQLLIPDGGYGLLVLEGDSAKNGGIDAWDYDYPATGIRFSNGADSIWIYDGTTLLDGVAYDNGVTFYDGSGASISLDPSAFDTTSNDAGANWCAASTIFGLGDAGTPGAANDSCP